ncbi:hypothetical protein JCM6882_006399 [Rhodosporidiobolus microsporus]
MSVDLSDPSIGQAYRDLRGSTPSIDWLRLGYKGLSSRLVLLGSGNGGLEELRGSLASAEVQFGLLRVEDRVLLWDVIPAAVGGVKRARALVHARALTGAFRGCSGILHATSPEDFDLSAVQARLNGSPSFHTTPPTQFPTTPSVPHSPNTAIHYPRDQFSAVGSAPPSPAVPQKPPSPLPNGFTTATSNLSIRSSSPHQNGSPAVQQTTSSHQTTPSYSSYASPAPQQQSFSAGFPSHLAPANASEFGAFVPSHSPTNGTAPHAFSTSRKGSLTPSQHTREPALSNSAPPASHVSVDPASEWRRQSHDRPSSPPVVVEAPRTTSSGPDSNGLFESAAAAMLAPLTPDPNSTDPPADGAMDLAPRPRFVTALSSAASLKPSVQSVPVDVVPSEDEEEEDHAAQEARAAAFAAAEAQARTQREEAARLERERREREAEDLAREEAERVRAAEVAAEEEERRRKEDEERREREAAEAAIREEEARARAEEERIRLEEEEKERAEVERLRLEEEERAREEEERLRLEEEERTRQAEEEMRLMIERQKLEKRLREEEEARRREEERVREAEEKRRALVEKRDRGEVMLVGDLNVQGGNSMFWKRRHFHLTSSGLALYKNKLETEQPLDTIPLTRIAKLTDGVEDALVPNSFKITFQDDDEYSFYTGEREEKEMLLAGIRCAARMSG